MRIGSAIHSVASSPSPAVYIMRKVKSMSAMKMMSMTRLMMKRGSIALVAIGR